MKVGILGGGLTGLAIASLLKRNGIDFEVLEKENECGGLMRSISENGFTFDYGGSHIIFSKDSEAMEFLTRTLGNNIIRNRRNTKILFRGRLVKYPFENGLSDLPDEDNFECVKYFLENLSRKEKGEIPKPENLKQWFYYTFGTGIAEKYLIPYNEKIWKYNLEKTSTEWVERIPNPPVEDIIKSSVGIETEGYTHQLYFCYPRTGGIQEVIKSLESGFEERIFKGFEIVEISRKGKSWIVSGSHKGKLEKREYDRIISTIPVQSLCESVKAPEKVKSAAGKLKYNSLVCVMLGIVREKLNDLSWLYIPERNIITHRVSFPSNYSDKNSPKGTSSILAEVTCNFNDKIWKMPEREIVERVVKDLERLDIIKSSEVCLSKAMKLRYAYVINDLDYRKNNSVVQEHFRKSGIGLVGRFSEFKYLNMDNCVRNAMDFVKREF